MLADQHTGDGTERIEGLSKIQAARGAFGGAEHGDQGIGGGLEKGKATGDDEQRHQEQAVQMGCGGRIEQKGARCIETEADQSVPLVAEPARIRSLAGMASMK